MKDPYQFSDVLNQCVREAGYTPGQLARMTGIPKTTIVSWLQGQVKRPRQWRDLIKLATTLRLSASQATTLLCSAGAPSVAELLEMADNQGDRDLLSPWADLADQQLDPAPFQAIPDLSYFVGRERELMALKEALLSGHRVTICSLQGMGGVGKTVLAAHLTYQLRPYFPDGVLWARLDASETLSVLSTFASAYGRDVSEYPDLDSRSRVVRELLSNKRALIVLDNAQNSDEITPLLPPSGTCAVIITTRRHDLSVTQGVFRFSLGPFSPVGHESLALFSKILGEKRANREKSALTEIAELLGHLPLAIAIAAGRLAYEPGWSAHDFLKRVCMEKQRLNELTSENQSVRVSFNLSYNTLSPAQQQFFATLGVFESEDFSTEAVAYITDQSLQNTQDTLRTLHSLSLIQYEQPGRYRLHPLLHDFAKEKINQNYVLDRMVEYFVRFAKNYEIDYDMLQLEHKNIFAALETAFRLGLHNLLIDGANAFSHFMVIRNLHSLAETHLYRAQQAAEAMGDSINQAALLLKRAQNAEHGTQYSQAESFLFEAMTFPEQPFELQANIYLQLGRVSWKQGNYVVARQNLEQALALARNTQSLEPISLPDVSGSLRGPQTLQRMQTFGSLRYVEAESLRMLGNIAYYKGEYVTANSHYQQALKHSREIDDLMGEGATLNNLGIVAIVYGDYTLAKKYFEQAAEIYRQLRYLGAEGWILLNLGEIDWKLGNYATAQAIFEQALWVTRETKDRGCECLANINLCITLLDQGEYSKAGDYGRLALKISREIKGQREEGNACHCLGLVHERQGDYPTARVYLEQALHIQREIGDRPGEVETMINLGLLFRHLGDQLTAHEYCEQALHKIQEPWDRHISGDVFLCFGHTLADLGSLTEAVDAYHQALDLRCALNQTHLTTEVLAGLASVRLIQGKWSQAQELVEKIFALLDTHTMNGLMEPFQVYLTCYQILRQTQDPRALATLVTANQLLQQRADRIKKKHLRKAFLQNVPAHREIHSKLTKANRTLAIV